MISLIFKSYFAILMSVGIGSILIFMLGLYFIFKLAKRKKLKFNTEIPTPIEKNVQSPASASDPCFYKLSEKDFKAPASKASLTITSQDINAIAGEDVLATQLDLARAYIETGRKHLAKKILDYVANQGNTAQQAEARRLLNYI